MISIASVSATGSDSVSLFLSQRLQRFRIECTSIAKRLRSYHKANAIQLKDDSTTIKKQINEIIKKRLRSLYAVIAKRLRSLYTVIAEVLLS
jgi:peptidoglycan hydrolase CwlO-like protein